MKKAFIIASFLFSFLLFQTLPAQAEVKRYQGVGEVVTVDPAYGRITINHNAIKGFSADEETDFSVTSPDLLRGLSRRDLVEFTIIEDKGDARVDGIKKYAVAPEKDDRLPIGKAVQGALESTAGAAKSVTTPIPAVHDVVGGTTDATTNATGAVLDDASNEVKTKF